MKIVPHPRVDVNLALRRSYSVAPRLAMVATLLACLFVGPHVFAAGPPTIRIDSVTPDGPWFPGDSLKITMKVTYTDAPIPGTVDMVVREISETETKEVIPGVAGSTFRLSFNEGNGTRTLVFPFYYVPTRSCIYNRRTGVSTCPEKTTLAETLVRLSKIQLVARLLDENQQEVVTATRDVDMKYPEIESLSAPGQPWNSEKILRIVVKDANFTKATEMRCEFFKADDISRRIFGATGPVDPAFNTCKEPGTIGGLGNCDFQVIDDSTLQFNLRLFGSPVTAGQLTPDSAFDPLVGLYDLQVYWVSPAPSADFHFRSPNAVKLGAYAIGAPAKDELLEFKKLTLSSTSPARTEVYVPGDGKSLDFGANAFLTATCEFEYKLTRRDLCRLWLMVRKVGQTAPLGFPRAAFYWTTLGQTVLVTEQVASSRRLTLSFNLPADASALEFGLVMTDAQSLKIDENVFVSAQPMILSLDTLTIADVLPPKDQIKGESIEVSANVTCKLVSRAEADLALRVFNLSDAANPVLLASSFDPAKPEQFHRVRKADGEQTLSLKTSPFKLPPGVTRLAIKAVLIDRLQPGVFLESTPRIEYDFSPPTLKVDTKEGISQLFAGDRAELTVTPLKADGKPDLDFSGLVTLSLDGASDKGIGVFDIGTGPADRAIVTLEKGALRETVSFRTPARQLNPNTPIRPDTVLKGKAVIVAELNDNSSVKANKTIEVRSPLDLIVDRIEVQQAVHQSLPDQNPLIQGKPMLVRVFVASNTGRFNAFSWVEGVKVSLVARDEGGNETSYTLDRNGSLTAPFRLLADPLKVDRTKGEESLGFIFTPQARSLSLSAILEPGFDEFPEEDKSRNTAEIGPVTFTPAKSIKVLYSPTRLDKGALSSSDLPRGGDLATAIRFCQLAYPLPEENFRFVPAPAVTLTSDPFLRDAFTIFTTQLWRWWNKIKGPSADARLFLVDEKYFDAVGKLGIRGETFFGLSIARADSPAVVARELGRTFGLRYSHDNARSVDEGSFVSWENAFAVVNEGRPSHRDFMGDLQPAWIDSISWNTLRSRFAAPTVGLQTVNENGAFAIIEGVVLTDGGGRLFDCYVLSGSNLASSSLGGDYSIELLDANGTMLERLDFTPEFQTLNPGPALAPWNFSFALPFSPAVRKIQLRKAAVILDTRNVSAAAPSVRFDSDFTGQTLAGRKQVRWSGSDPDGDPLRYSLFYSPDGELQIPLAESITATTFDWNTDELPSGPAPRLTVVTTDGLLTATAETAPFVIPNRGSRIFIVAPGEGALFESGEPILFQGVLLDPEDGLRSSVDLMWASDKQGVLGKGSSLLVTDLTTGTHVITATGSDSAAQTAAASIMLIVSSGSLDPVALTATFAQGVVRLSWPAAAAGFVLQSTESLAPPITWSAVAATVGANGDQNTLTVAASDSVRFYRLTTP